MVHNKMHINKINFT